MSHTATTAAPSTALAALRAHPGTRRTVGLDDATLDRLADHDLVAAIDAAVLEHARLVEQEPALLDLDEQQQIEIVQAGLVNFYPSDDVNPYVALAARGPWVITLKGAVLYDVGGYGMLGFGHTPQAVLSAMGAPAVMANVMTPSMAQLRADRALRAEIGHTRGRCPYAQFMCLNSGSEAVGLAARLADTHARSMTDHHGRYPGAPIKRVVVKGSFHGRTDRPALLSDSSRATYQETLASFRDEDSVLVVDPYDVGQLTQVFAHAREQGWFIEMMVLEPVMGEGDPGRAVPPEFYAAARELTAAHSSLLVIDSIQAGLRATGALSIVDYPGFEGMAPPDLETFSKALNAGQYPLSVLALTDHAAGIYRQGTYGNTMTANPRALDVATAVLGLVTDDVRDNIRTQGRYAVERLTALMHELDGPITAVQGTGLLFSCALAPGLRAYGAGSVEEWLREHGIGVIHGGENSLRFTPRFDATSTEIDLVVDGVRRAVQARSH